MPDHQTAFEHLKNAIVQAPILHYPNPNKAYIVYTDALDDACRAQLSQEHDGTEFPVAFLSHTFSETQCKWSTTEQEAFGVYYAITKWNYYLQGANIIVRNDHKPLARFLNGKNANNKVNRWSLELATYNITFEWISGAKNKAADCLSRLVSPMRMPINMLTASVTDGPAFHTRSHTQNTSDTTPINPATPQPHLSPDSNPTPKSIMEDCQDALLQMQHTDPFCKCISKCLLNGKAPHHESDTFTHVKGLLYKHVSDAGKQFLALVIPKSWKFTILMEAHDKLGHQGNNCTYCLIKCQYYWKGMNKDIRKYIANCALCRCDKAKVQQYPLQMTEIPDRPFDKIAIDLVTDCETSTSGNKHILTIIDHLTGWPEAFPIPDKSADTIVATLINHYLLVHMCPRYILLDNGTEFKNNLMDQVLKQLGIDRIFSAPYHPQSNRKLEVFHKYLKPTLKKLCEKDPANWDKYINQVLASYRITPNLATTESPFFLVYGRDPNLPLHQLLEPMQCFLGDPDLGKLHLETHRLALAIAKKTLDENRFLTTQKTTSRTNPNFQIGDRVYFKNKQPGKWDLKWRPRYWIVRIE